MLLLHGASGRYTVQNFGSLAIIADASFDNVRACN